MWEHPVALVTGSSRGIGRAIVEELARRGHAVVVNYVRGEAAAQEVVAMVQQRGGQAVRPFVQTDDDLLAVIDATYAL